MVAGPTSATPRAVPTAPSPGRSFVPVESRDRSASTTGTSSSCAVRALPSPASCSSTAGSAARIRGTSRPHDAPGTFSWRSSCARAGGSRRSPSTGRRPRSGSARSPTGPRSTTTSPPGSCASSSRCSRRPATRPTVEEPSEGSSCCWRPSSPPARGRSPGVLAGHERSSRPSRIWRVPMMRRPRARSPH